MRIAGLVRAVKGFTHMDQATAPDPIEIAQGLCNTVAVLNAKARGKSVAAQPVCEPGLPRVRGFGGELNQIWGNLIDNALDAVTDDGRVDGAGATARREGRGAGRPTTDRASRRRSPSRIFDPFFTTKPVGQGTGLGLDIVRRLVLHNEGEISVAVGAGPDRVPGRAADRRDRGAEARA